MAIQNQGFRRDLNLSETENDRNAFDNLAGAGANADISFLQNNLRNRSAIAFYSVDSDGFFSSANDRVIKLSVFLDQDSHILQPTYLFQV